MCEGGVEVARGGDGARLLVELGANCDHLELGANCPYDHLELGGNSDDDQLDNDDLAC